MALEMTIHMMSPLKGGSAMAPLLSRGFGVVLTGVLALGCNGNGSGKGGTGGMAGGGAGGALHGTGGQLDGSPIMVTETRTIVEFPIPTVGIYDSLPMFIAASSDGNMWFTNSNRNSVSRITPDGLITEFKIPTTSSGPGDLVLGPDGNLWFPESGAGKIASINPEGSFTELAIPASGSAKNDIVFGPDGAIWFPERKDAIGRMTLDGTLTEYPVPLVPNANWTTEQPEGIAIGPDGNLWFTDGGGGDIARMGLTGTITQFTLPTRGIGPRSIAVGGDGNLWFGEESYRLGRITPSGVITELQLPTGDQPGRFASAPDGNLWLTVGVGNEGNILRISPDGVITKFLIPTENGKATDVAVGPDGKVWFTQWAIDQIGYFEPE
jgi:virginiamycin B lyase